MKRYKLIFAVWFLFAGCTHTINLALRPDFSNNLYEDNQFVKLEPKITFAKGTFTDKREDISTVTTFKEGVHTYNLYETRPLDEVLFDGLITLLNSSGHRWNPDDAAEVKVNLQLLSVHASRNSGMFKVGAISGIQIKLDFVNEITGEPIYTEVYNGADKRDRALFGGMSMVEESLDASIIDCFNRVGDDISLAAALRKTSAEPVTSIDHD